MSVRPETLVGSPCGSHLYKSQIEASWAAEVERHFGEIESGHAKLIPAAESIARARAAIQ